MATFSPSPTPRRTVRRLGGNSPPTASRRIKIGSSRPTSRLATPAHVDRLSVIRDVASSSPGMDVDGVNPEWESKSEIVFAKSDELLVSFGAHLPAEVRQVLKNTDFYSESYTGAIDTITGFALIASIQTCFVWQYVQAINGVPTCYIFSCPRDFAQAGPPLHVLVPYGSSREPGLILISPSGAVRFWDSIGNGLAGGDHFSTISLGLTSEESATNLIRSDPQTYIASSSTGRLFRLTLTSSGGKHHLNAHPFSRPQQLLSFSRLIPNLWSSPSSNAMPESGNISAVASGEDTALGKEIWALVDTRVQKWNVTVEGWEDVLMDEELSDIIRPAIRDAFSSASVDDSALDLELLDLAIEKNAGNLVILASYAGTEEVTAMDIGSIRRVYALICLSSTAETFVVKSVSSIPYQSTSTSGAPMHPRLGLVLDGSVVSIQFGDAVALCAKDSNYQDRLELKSYTDRTLGVGVIENDSALLVLTATSMMKVFLDVAKVASFNKNSGRANLIKSIMTQAILYGSIPRNPLKFSFPPEIDEESLMQGAEQLSQSVLESDTELVQRNHDLTAQLIGRKERLNWLIQFINDNAVLSKMSQRCKQKLASDAEKLHACHQLWSHHNDVLGTGHVLNVLSDAVQTYMNDIGEGHHEDVMRAFFRHKVGDISELLPQVLAICSRGLGRSFSASLPEANNIVLTVLKSAFDFRESNIRIYGVELPVIDPWTSQPAVIDTVLDLFEGTTRYIETPSPSSGASEVRGEPIDQLPELASILLACIQERLEWLGSNIAAEETGVKNKKVELENRFTQLRPEILEVLRRHGHAEPAFQLAEKYHDFQSLASLCHKGENPNTVRIQSYLEKFKERFANELYRWYIEHGELRVMFAQEDIYSGYLDVFFAENSHPSVSWIHDIGKCRYGPASQTLHSEAQHSTNLQAKQLMLSIGKLAHLAQLHETEAPADESILDGFHDDLDFVSVQETLMQSFKPYLKPVRGKQTIDSQVDTIANAEASMISDRKALLQVFKQLVRQLLQGKALSIEDAADILTLKDNQDGTEDYAIALHLLARAKNIPEARRLSACRSVWRRIYIHDDWNTVRRTANVTDLELSERFKRTAMYSALHAVIPRQYQRQGYDLTPAQALPIPSQSEIIARWPGMAPDSVEEIVANHQHESDQVADLELDDVYHRIREMVVQEVIWGGAE